jgi:hypothetical protein
VNLPLMVGLACIIIFGIGLLIGQGLNGRAQIDRDKWRANAQREINERKRDLRLTAAGHLAPSKE